MRLCRKHPTYSGRGVAAPRVPGPHSVFTGIETTHFIKTCNKPQPDTFRIGDKGRRTHTSTPTERIKEKE